MISATYKSLVAHQFACEPKEGLLEVVVGFGGDVVVLKILLAVERNGLGLDFSFLHVYFVPGQNDWNVLAYADQIAVPVRHVLVCDARCDVEHDNATLAIDVVSIS